MNICSNKKAFTLAETIMTLFIVGLVVTAAIPAFTIKKQTAASDSGATGANSAPWNECTAYSDSATSIKNSLCSQNPIVINDDGASHSDALPVVPETVGVVTKDYADLSIYGPAAATPYTYFIDDERVLRIADLYIEEKDSNLFLVRGVEPTIRRSAKGANTLHNLVITSSGFNFPSGTYSFNNNVFIGNNMFPLVKNMQNNVVIGHLNKLGSEYPTNPQFNMFNAFVFGENFLDAGGKRIFPDPDAPTKAKLKTVFIGSGANIVASALIKEREVYYVGGKNHAVIFPNDNKKMIYFGDYIVADGSATSSPQIKFKGNLHINTALAMVSGGGGGTLTSDIRLKNIKGEYKKGINEILKINPVRFYYNTDKTSSEQYGIIAQDIQPIFPEAVIKAPSGYLMVDESPMFFAAANALKEINMDNEIELKRTQKLQEELIKLEDELKELTSCKANDIWGKINCIFIDIKRFFKGLTSYFESEVKNEKV